MGSRAWLRLLSREENRYEARKDVELNWGEVERKLPWQISVVAEKISERTESRLNGRDSSFGSALMLPPSEPPASMLFVLSTSSSGGALASTATELGLEVLASATSEPHCDFGVLGLLLHGPKSNL